jgi:hypothetical protein
VDGFAVGNADFGTAVIAQAYAIGGSVSGGDIVWSVRAYGDTAMGGTATVNWIAWGS